MLKTEKTASPRRAKTPMRLCALFSAVALAACGGGKEEAAPPPPVAAPAPAPAPAPVVTAPAITTQPAAATVAVGASASFSVTASGTTPISYQWQRNGTAISGATGASYSFNATEADSGAEFRVVVSNSAGSVTSSAAVLTVQPVVLAPSIAVAPQAAATLDGGTATFVVVAEGTGPFTYAWQRNGSAIAGANAASYTTPDLTLADTGARYRVVVGNSAGSVTSSEATLTVNPVAPAIATAPANVAVTAGQTATFNASATGSAPLAYQWQRNGTAIAGATAASYTTPATTVADNGARFRVVVTNAGGSVTSAEATLGVTAAVVAPAIASAPVGATVQEGQTATFTASATGTAPLAYQWLRNGTAISGATAASYTTAATTVAGDNNARFSVRVSNAAGTVTSGEVVLTVQAAASPLVGRAWTAAQALEGNDGEVEGNVVAIDDAGRSTVVFLKADGGRNVLYATHGTPGAAGQAPTWSAPEVIDSAGGVAFNGMTGSNLRMGLAASANGNLVAFWFATEPCDATTYNTSGTCRVVYTARRLRDSGSWEAPLRVASAPSDTSGAEINDRGDIALLIPGWVRTGTTGSARRVAVAMRERGASSFTVHTFAAGLAAHAIGLDNAGNVLLAAEAAQNSTVDIVSYRGTVGGGFGNAEILDQRVGSATLRFFAVGRGGQQIVMWTQSNGISTTLHAASSTGASDVFQVQDLGITRPVGNASVQIDDQGSAWLLDLSDRRRLRWQGGNWSSAEALPANTPNSSFLSCAFVRNGDFMCLQNSPFGGQGGSHGVWVTYDASRNLMVQPLAITSPGSGYVLGVNTTNREVGLSDPVLSISGHAAVTLQGRYDTLPSPSQPAGEGRQVTNLFGAFFK